MLTERSECGCRCSPSGKAWSPRTRAPWPIETSPRWISSAGSLPDEACRKRRPSSPRSKRGFGSSDPSIERHPVSVVRYAATAGGVVPAIMPAFLALFSIVTLLTVLIVSANVANLMLARSMARQRETAAPTIARCLATFASSGCCSRKGCRSRCVAWLAACLMTVWAVRVDSTAAAADAVEPGRSEHGSRLARRVVRDAAGRRSERSRSRWRRRCASGSRIRCRG